MEIPSKQGLTSGEAELLCSQRGEDGRQPADLFKAEDGTPG